MADDRSAHYANALLSIARAEGDAGAEDQLAQFGDVLHANSELRETVADSGIPAARRQQIIEDALEGKASPATVAGLSMVVGAGRGRDLPEIIGKALSAGAAGRNKTLAEVRTAVELSEDQKQRLAEALSQKTGKDVEVRNIVDESVKGGVLAQIGDLVFDGTVRTRLNKLREAI